MFPLLAVLLAVMQKDLLDFVLLLKNVDIKEKEAIISDFDSSAHHTSLKLLTSPLLSRSIINPHCEKSPLNYQE